MIMAVSSGVGGTSAVTEGTDYSIAQDTTADCIKTLKGTNTK
jgi:hypothetical protein